MKIIQFQVGPQNSIWQGGIPGTVSLWSRNFTGWIQSRALLDT